MIPGGLGVRNPDLGPELEFVRRLRDEYGLGGSDPKKYLVTVCNGAAVPARAGVLNGRRATTNKSVWGEVVPLDPGVKWLVFLHSVPSPFSPVVSNTRFVKRC